MRLLIAALALAMTACSPTTGSGDAVPGQTAEAACVAQGGSMQRVGRLQSLQCVTRYADAAKRCTSGDQCQGDCLYEGAAVPGANASVAGQCAADRNRFGCRTTIENGRAQPTLCID